MAATTTAKTRVGVGGPMRNYALPIGAKSPTVPVATRFNEGLMRNIGRFINTILIVMMMGV